AKRSPSDLRDLRGIGRGHARDATAVRMAAMPTGTAATARQGDAQRASGRTRRPCGSTVLAPAPWFRLTKERTLADRPPSFTERIAKPPTSPTALPRSLMLLVTG